MSGSDETCSATVSVALCITVSLGTPSFAGIPATSVVTSTREVVAGDYDDREGYRSDFLGERFEVSLPQVSRATDDVLTFDDNGRQASVLRYKHFSVVMSRSRRMCFLSACNIDGRLSKKSARAAWKWDPRIPQAQQIMHECYGNPPKFSRGHMTRREDPGWGGDVEVARRGNEDSMHVTNTVPQMQAFNAPIWLALEDYSLQHARQDEMHISVFTGPFFSTHDRAMYGVLIPVAFWKVIAFIHDDTGRLCATGYQMDQKDQLPSAEFVYGEFDSPQLSVATQVPIAAIAERAGIDFGRLVDVDPLAGRHEEGVGATAPLQALEQIRFLR
ncbi:DNA/RNA non-specific endonuclease [Mesorhizobium sp. CO1-1-2]|uniref:DNA/RNA non-specific endonuclease n=1 Tax=Mesorhizobium sp. CO1-1-2 TaxID=2876635 RepID=UPI001CC9D5CE|nr:DNA/RNA non-specific endonuclease [Mesorhizobium sp. CO1-1-2]MBZ9683344.1 DNA/RNA non-specific endonuclease [Mesorhizobium sp. CO1-1-2]